MTKTGMLDDTRGRLTIARARAVRARARAEKAHQQSLDAATPDGHALHERERQVHLRGAQMQDQAVAIQEHHLEVLGILDPLPHLRAAGRLS